MQLQLFLTYKNCEYKNTLLLSTTYGDYFFFFLNAADAT